jgi:hypothetical protein
MKLANFVTLARKVIRGRTATPAADTSSKTAVTQVGKRLTVPQSHVNTVYRTHRHRHVRIEYTGPTKATCLGCGQPFLFVPDGRGRYPDYRSNACKQKAYRARKNAILPR